MATIWIAAGVFLGCLVGGVLGRAQLPFGQEQAEGPGVRATAVPTDEKVVLLVARKYLPMHLGLGQRPEEFFEEKQFSKDAVPVNALGPADLTKLQGKHLQRYLWKGEPVTEDDVFVSSMGLGGLATPYRAVRLCATATGVRDAASELPGSHVDVFLSPRASGGAPVCELLLEDVIVLAVDEAADPLASHDIYVALTAGEALKARSAMRTGTLRLVLRSPRVEASNSMGRREGR
jgi:Flp pilus assembly protein CpaB